MRINGKLFNYTQESCHIDPLLWLEQQPLYPKIFWHAKDADESFATSGAVLQVDQIPEIDAEQEVRFFGGMSFFHQSDPLWECFGSCRFFLPSLQLHTKNGAQIVTKYQGSPLRLPPTSLPSLQQGHHLSYQQWENNIRDFLALCAKKELTKVVFARRTTIHKPKNLQPLLILKELQKKATASTLFCFQLSSEVAFLGATPERLYKREKNKVHSEALAGTRTKKEGLSQELLASAKEREEFSVVKECILSKLTPLCTSIETPMQPHIYSTATLHHLYAPITAELKPSVLDKEILAALHPTPAVAGYPQDLACNYLQQQESFVRGWYAAPIGWFSNKGADLAVGIRSALVTGTQVHLFAGAGIVANSKADKEWEELDHKIAPLQNIVERSYE